MKRLFLPAFALIALLFQACNSNSSKTNDTTTKDTVVVADEHTSQSSLDWAGTYDGTIPCADCSGIKTIIKLNPDNTFSYSAEYLEKNTTAQDSGKFMWHDNGSIIHLMGKDLNTKYKVGENLLIQLDESGNVIEGPIAEQYYLVKVQ